MDPETLRAKFEFPAEILPLNERTAEILKKREEEEAIRK